MRMSVQPHWFVAAIVAALLAATTTAWSAADAGAPTTGVGFREFNVVDPIGGGAMSAVAFYPASVATATTTIGPYAIAATRNARYLGGNGLVVLSHGTGGSKWDLHDLAQALARAGYVVASVTHPGDNFKDKSGLGTDRVLIGRERQMSALIDRVLADPVLGANLDRKNIYAGGFSAGGYTALVLAGAQPNFALLNAYCQTHEHDPTFCWDGRATKVGTSGLRAVADPRVRAVIAMAPVGLYFDRAGLAKIHVPVLLFDGQDDDVLAPADNSRRIASFLGLSASRFIVIPRARHFVFLAPCTSRMRALAPPLCIDPPGVDRVAVHARIQHDVVRFLSAFTR